MQCPPIPGPGVNFMNPNGLVAAASITSQTFTPSLSHTIAISLTRPMLTERNVFSSSLTSSAVSVDETGTMVSRQLWYRALATSVHAGVIPPTTFGVFLVCQNGLPGSTRSGLNARNTSVPILSPAASSLGCMSSRVVPGYVVLSSTTSIPGCANSQMVAVAATT